MTSPAAQRRPPLLHSPFVPSIMRCDSAEDEDKRQRAAARCALQQANIALFVCAVILKRIIVEALPRTSPPGDEKETKSQEVRRHTGVIFTRVHARFLYEVVAPALGIPRDVLTAVFGASNSAGRANDDHGLIKVESLLHGRADLVADGIDQARLFDPWVQASFPMYGPLLQRGANGETIVWTSSGRGAPSSRYPLTLSAGTIADGALYTVPGKFALGFIHDLSRLSPEFITAVLMSITSGSARRGGTEWEDLPLGADWPSALLTEDARGSAVPTESQMAQSVCDKAKVFFSVYRAMPINEQGPALARGEPSITLDGDGGLLHLQEGRFAADAALIPPTSLIGVEARAGLVDIYCRYRRQYARGPHRDPAAFESMDMDEEGPSPAGVRGGIDPAPLTAVVGLSSDARAAAKRRCIEALPVPPEASVLRRAVEWAGLAPKKEAMERMVDQVMETTIDETLARADILGQIELQERISLLSSRLQEMATSRDRQKEQKQRFKSQVAGLQTQLHQALEDLQQARIGRQDGGAGIGAGIGATDASDFALQLAETRATVREREVEADTYKKAFERADAAKDDAHAQLRLVRERMAQELLVAQSKVTHLQGINESNSAKLCDCELYALCVFSLLASLLPSLTTSFVRGTVCREDYSTLKSKAAMFDILMSKPAPAPQDATTSAHELIMPYVKQLEERFQDSYAQEKDRADRSEARVKQLVTELETTRRENQRLEERAYAVVKKPLSPEPGSSPQPKPQPRACMLIAL
jgi:hypothetical protein